MISRAFIFIFLLSGLQSLAQKDSLQKGDRYADDQLYASISYNQFYNQPTLVNRSSFSFGISTGFMKDFILNKNGTLSFAGGIGYGFDSFNHKLKPTKVNNEFVFLVDGTISSNNLSTHNLEFPLEFRWRTSSANKYKFWRIYTGVKFSYNLSNTFSYSDAANQPVSFKNISPFNNLQYGLTLSAGYDAFNIQIYYGLTPVLNDALIGTESINTKILKFGFIFYIL